MGSTVCFGDGCVPIERNVIGSTDSTIEGYGEEQEASQKSEAERANQRTLIQLHILRIE